VVEQDSVLGDLIRLAGLGGMATLPWWRWRWGGGAFGHGSLLAVVEPHPAPQV